jgi:regulator of RNase E activity RraA
LLVKYSKISTATMGHRVDGNAMDSGIRMFVGGPIIAGPALTVRTLGRDSTVCHKVFDLAMPGDILVVDRGGDQHYACWGEMMSLAAKNCGIAGVIVDGLVTDIEALRAIGVPVYARGLSPITTLLLGEGGSINTPVGCGGLRVLPGTLVIADEDGILVLDSVLATDSLNSFEAEAEEDEIYRTKLLDGKLPSQLSPIDALIKGSVNDRS